MNINYLSYEKHVDGLRALAVLLVVIGHLFPGRIPGGFIGVDIFFVISGYLISRKLLYQLHAGEFRFGDFYWRRAKRLGPALVVVLSSSLLLGWFILFPLEYANLAKHAVGGIVFISNFLMMSEAGYFDDAAITKPLMHLWSLGVEEQYYLVFPAIVAALWAIPVFKRNLLAIFVSLTMASFFFCLVQTFYNPSVAYYSPVTRAWEFMFGVLYAYITMGLTSRSNNLVGTGWIGGVLAQLCGRLVKCERSLIGLLILGLALLAIRPSSNFPGFLAVLPALAALCIISDQGNGVAKRTLFESKLSVLLGKISYPLYLWHWPLISFANYLGMNGRVEKIAILMLSLLLAFATWRYIELPTQHGFTSLTGRLKVKIALFFSMVCVTALSLLTVLWGGFEGRSISSYAKNQKELIRTHSVDVNCMNNLDERIDYCRGSFEPDTETIAVIGDSHAHAAFPGIERLLAERGKKAILLANSGCPPLLRAEYGRTEYEKEKCRLKIRAINEFVIRHDNIKTVLIFTRGAAYIEPLSFSPGSAPSAPLISPDAFAKALEKTTAEYGAAGKGVYYVIENPTLPFHPIECIKRPFSVETRDCSQKLSTVLQQQKLYRETLGRVANTKVIDTSEAFCPDQNCLTHVEGRVLYADQNHLSVWGSEFQAQIILAPHVR